MTASSGCFELFFLVVLVRILHAGCDQRDAQERGAPRGHQLGGGADVGGVIGPAEEFVGEGRPPCYCTLRFADFKRMHNVVNLGSSLNQITNIKSNQE